MPTQTTMSAKNRVLFWVLIIALLLGFLYLFSDILLPFVLGAGIAYLLDPVVTRLTRLKISRTWASVTILLLFFIAVAAVLALIVPFAYREIMKLADAAPLYVEQLWEMAAPYIGWMQQMAGETDTEQLKAAIQNNVSSTLKMGGGVLAGLASGGQALIGFLTVSVLTPIVAFFMMREWPQMTDWIDAMIPRRSYDTVKTLLRDINSKVSGFIRGQIMVAALLGIIYAVALMIAGLNFGFLIGLMAGLLSLIPLVGSTAGLLVSVVVAWFQSGEWSYVAIIAAIFLTGQFVEGNIITPRVLGKSVGMHPLWILFALLAGGAAFGIVGMLLAVPVAAAAGVLIGFAISRYKASPLYKNKPAKPVTKKSAGDR